MGLFDFFSGKEANNRDKKKVVKKVKKKVVKKAGKNSDGQATIEQVVAPNQEKRKIEKIEARQEKITEEIEEQKKEEKVKQEETIVEETAKYEEETAKQEEEAVIDSDNVSLVEQEDKMESLEKQENTARDKEQEWESSFLQVSLESEKPETAEFLEVEADTKEEEKEATVFFDTRVKKDDTRQLVYVSQGEKTIFDNPRELEKKLFRAFLKEVEQVAGKEALKIAMSYQKDVGDIHLIEALVETNQMKPRAIFNILKEIFEREEIGNVFFMMDYKVIDIEKRTKDDGEEELIYLYEGKRIEPRFHFSRLSTVPQDSLLAILPLDEYNRLMLATKVAKHGEVKFTFEEVLKDALAQGASDIHILNKGEGFYVAFRIKKQLIFQPQYFMNKQEWEAFINLLNKQAADENIGYFSPDNRRIAQEAKLSFPELGCFVRYEFIPDGYSLKYGEVICRILKKDSISGKEPLEDRLKRLGYDDEKTIKILKNITNLEGGLIVVSGKTNSGKSTFLAQLLASIPETRKVGTIEDPIEYNYANRNIIQHQLYLPNSHEKMGFTEYVKAFKRADYDVVLVGEWRRAEGLTEAMVEQAEAGQLIFTTLHIASAYDIYLSLHNIFGVPFDISANLIIFSFNQTLAPVLCPYCSDETIIEFTEEEVALLKYLTNEDKKKLSLFREVGRKYNPEKARKCPYCKGVGYSGFTPIYEYFVPDEEIRNKVVEAKTELSPVALRSMIKENDRAIATFKIDIALEKLKKGMIDKEIIFKL